jgi:hypothetical protein
MKRGRKSAASLTVVPAAEIISIVERPQPPAELSLEQAVEWRAIVDRLPAGWFPRETWPLLSQYCRHVVNARRVAQLLAQHEGAADFNTADYGALLAMQERETKAILATARGLKLSQQARVEPKTAGRLARDSKPGPRPWD